jgi:hypothetical protein
MPNVHVTTSLVLRDTLATLENDLVMANLVSTDYSSEFTKVGDTVNARKPIRFAGQSNNLDVSGYNEDLIEGTVPVRLQKTETIKFSIDQKDKKLRATSCQPLTSCEIALSRKLESSTQMFSGLQERQEPCPPRLSPWDSPEIY